MEVSKVFQSGFLVWLSGHLAGTAKISADYTALSASSDCFLLDLVLL